MAMIPQEVLDSVPAAVLVIDSKRRILCANRAALDMFGTAAVGRDLALSMRHPRVLDGIDAVLRGTPEKYGEITLPVPVARSLSFRVERLRHAPLEDGSVATVVLNDVTAARKAEEMRADFVANVSHELRSPLTALLGFIETLRGPASDDTEARVRFLDIMHREALRMSRLIEDLLSLSRVEINEHVPPRHAISVTTVLRNVIEVLEQQAADRGIGLRFEAADGLPDAVGDADQLNQVFRNLIENALKYAGSGKPVRIVAETIDRIPGTGKHGLAIHVIDQGPGIDKELIPRLTERFYRVDKARSNVPEAGIGSTGLGLAIVKHIISRHRGHLTVESQVGEGSTFTVFLPAFTSARVRKMSAE